MADEVVDVLDDELKEPAADPKAEGENPEAPAEPADDAPVNFGALKRYKEENATLKESIRTEREERLKLAGQIEALSRQPAQPPKQKSAEELAREKAEIEADPAAYHQRVAQDWREEQTRIADKNQADTFLEAAPESRHPEFADRMVAILKDFFGDDYEFRKWPATQQYRLALREYRKQFPATKAAEVIKPAPPAGRNGGTGEAAGEVTTELLNQIKTRWAENPDATGKGWGQRMREKLRKEGKL